MKIVLCLFLWQQHKNLSLETKLKYYFELQEMLKKSAKWTIKNKKALKKAFLNACLMKPSTSHLTADPLTNVSDKAFTTSETARAVALDTFKVFGRVWSVSLLHKLKFYGISGWLLTSFFLFHSNTQQRVFLVRKYSKEYPINADFHEGSILGPTFFLLNIYRMISSVILLSTWWY